MMRAILMFHNCEGQSHKTVSTDHNFRSEKRAKADLIQVSSTYQPNALLLGQTGSLERQRDREGLQKVIYIYIYIYIYMIKIKETLQVGLKSPKLSANNFLGGLFLTTERG